MAKTTRGFMADIVETILILLIVFITLNIFLGQLLVITGNSMLPTLRDREQIIGEKASLNFVELKRGEIIIFDHPLEQGLIIKRIIALPNDTITIENGQVYINGERLNEPYLYEDDTTEGNFLSEGDPIEVPEKKYVVMGDNRNNSVDSRTWGFLPEQNIKARGLLVYYPIDSFRVLRNNPAE